MSKKTLFEIFYWDKFGNTKSVLIKARDKYKAETQFYKTHYYDLVKYVIEKRV